MHAWRIVLFHPLLCATYVLCDQFCFQAHLTAVRCSPPQHHCPARDVWRAKFGRNMRGSSFGRGCPLSCWSRLVEWCVGAAQCVVWPGTQLTGELRTSVQRALARARYAT